MTSHSLFTFFVYTADEPRDYTFVQDEVAFHDCETSCFVSLLIVDDTETEFDESLFIGLEVEGSDRVVPFTSPSTQILIIDDDGIVAHYDYVDTLYGFMPLVYLYVCM